MMLGKLTVLDGLTGGDDGEASSGVGHAKEVGGEECAGVKVAHLRHLSEAETRGAGRVPWRREGGDAGGAGEE
jgi:hypothetical protein